MNGGSRYQQMISRLGMYSSESEAEWQCPPGGWREDARGQVFKVVQADALKFWSMRIGPQRVSNTLSPT